MARGERKGERADRSESFATIRHAHAQATQRAIVHHENSRDQWTQRRNDELLAVFGVTNEAAPDWATLDLQRIAHDCATRAVDTKLAEQLHRIHNASFRMSLTGKVRETRSPVRKAELGDIRKANKGKGLGE